ncbi:integrase core domain-containing protein [Micrococcus luteus]|uniref:integrase core domain-containing protein n=1 Tax=Micrococcus luteus TaxID=1270 RepID=UPI00130D8A17|nr:integrase core domain-containing protein [Micrococcus luteus]QQE47792.1 transposase [Micrococcus luteus]
MIRRGPARLCNLCRLASTRDRARSVRETATYTCISPESVEAVELATMGWVHWWNTTRLHEALGYRPPAEVEAAYTHDQDSAPVAS